MRQGNGTELLGTKDSQSANVGIIYVSPTDDRKTVLAAILTQEKLGRRQIAVVLPDQNKAFQRPVDFDDLKSLRRKLRAPLVFIAPGGSDLAELARKRHFTVYSSLENYASALRDQEQEAEQKKKGHGLFGSARYKAALAGASAGVLGRSRNGSGQEEQRPKNVRHPSVVAPLHQQLDEDEEDYEQHHHMAPAVLGGAAVGAAALGADALYNEQARSTPHIGSHLSDEENVDNIDAMSVVNPHEMPEAEDPTEHEPAEANEDDAALPPPLPVVVPVAADSTYNAASAPPPARQPAAAAPEAIDLQPVRPRGRSTLKLPQREDDEAPVVGAAAAAAAVGAAAAAASKPAPRTRPNSGKLAGAAAAGSAVAASAAMGQRATAGGGQPPVRGNAGGGGGGSNGPVDRRRRRRWLAALLILATMLVVFGVLYSLMTAYPNSFRPLQGMLPKPVAPATVSITPDSKVVANSYVILAIPNGTPNPDQRQISARSISSQPLTQTKTVTGTGHNQIAASVAKGRLLFINGAPTPFTVGAGQQLSASNGVTIVTDAPAFVPAANPGVSFGETTVTAHASTPGANGNIPALSISGTCCAAGNSISVKNDNAFTGGQDAKDYNFVQQGDVDAFASAAAQQLTQQANSALRSQLKPGEQLANATKCPSAVSNDNPVGDLGRNIPSTTVTVSVTCKAVAYDQNGMQALVTKLLQAKATTDAGPGYALKGNIIVHSQVQSVNPDNSVSLLVSTKGLWVYQFSNEQKQQLAKQIAGKNVDTAKSFLLSQPGIHDVTITSSNSVLPTDPSQISLVIQDVSGLQDTGNPTPEPTVIPPNGGSGGTPTPQPGQGNKGSQIG